jgi:uncharacterized membrane protein HdeD (DUF308 family)
MMENTRSLLRYSSEELILRGVLALLLAVLTFSQPHATLVVILSVFGFYALFDGLLALWGAVRAAREHQRYWPSIFSGLLGIAVGVLAFARPLVTLLVLLLMIAARAIAVGVLEIAAAFELHEHGWLLGLSGLASVIFGALLLSRPAAGLLTLVWLVGVYGLIYGISLLTLGLRVRGITRRSYA